MKVLAFLLASMISAQAMAAPGVDGAQFLKLWNGTYEVTQCLQCPDVKTDTTNLKFFSGIDIFSFRIPSQDKVGCSQVDFYIAWGPNFNNQNGMAEGIGHTTGQCQWGVDEFLKVTPETFEYKTLGKNPADEADFVSVTKQSDGTYLIDLKSERKTPAWGFPLTYELKAIAKKTR